MLIREISFSIHEKAKAFDISDDSVLTEDYIWYLMDVYRALLARKAYRETGGIDGFYQLSCCVPVKCDKINCDGLWSGDNIFYMAPNELLRGVGDTSVIYAGPTDFSKRGAVMRQFDKLSWEAWLSLDSADWTGNRPGYTIISGYKDGDSIESDILPLKNLPTDGIKTVCLNAAFARPVENICNDEVDEFHYPIRSDLIAKLELLVVKDIVQSEAGTIGDPINDMASMKNLAILQGGQPQEQKPPENNIE
ncbi:MAG: hypothetical protein ACLFT4_00175 [Bacteroidales bacterium]